MNGFPRVRRQNFTGESGVNLVSSIVNTELSWIFRTNHEENDFGIDGYIDVVTEDGYVTGQSFAIQIKAGPSFFKNKSPNGYVFYGDKKHLNYYLNNQLPVLIVICDLELGDCYWQCMELEKVEKTDLNWKINIPRSNLLIKGSTKSLLSLLPPLIDSEPLIEQQDKVNKMFENQDKIYYSVSSEEIKNNDISVLKSFFRRLASNDLLFRNLQGKLELTVDGYDNHKKELYEIKEVRRWFKKANKKISYWFYLLTTDKPATGLKLLFLCNSRLEANMKEGDERVTGHQVVSLLKKGKQLPKMEIIFNTVDVAEILEVNFHRLNEITDYLGFSNDENVVISQRIVDVLDLNKV